MAQNIARSALDQLKALLVQKQGLVKQRSITWGDNSLEKFSENPALVITNMSTITTTIQLSKQIDEISSQIDAFIVPLVNMVEELQPAND